MDLVTKEFIYAPEFTKSDIESLQTYFELNKKYSRKIEDELVLNLSGHKVWGPLISSMSPEKIRATKDRFLQLLHGAIYEGKWEEYGNELISESKKHAQIVRYADWYELVKMYKALVLPHFKNDFAESAENAIMFLDGLSKLSDYTLFVIAEAYFKEKNDIIKEKGGQASKADIERRILLNRISDGVISVDKDWRYTFINDAALAFHPESREAGLGRVIWDVHPELVRTVFWDKYHEAMLTRRIVEIESYYAPLDIWFSVKIYPSSNGLTIFYNNITESKKAGEQIRINAKELLDYKNALDKASIVAITDHKGIIIHVNDNFCRISKYSREELIGQDHRIINSGHHPKEFIKNLWNTIGNGQIWKGELKNKAKDGTNYWVDTTIVPFLKDGKPYQYVAIRSDITESKETLAGLIDSEKRLNEAQAIAHLGNWELNFATGTAVWSEEACRIYHISPEEKNMQSYDSWIKFVHPEDLERVTAIIKESQKTLSNTVLDHRIILKDGTIKYIEGEARFEFDRSGRPIGLYGVAHDVTEKRISEEDLKQRESRLNESQSIAQMGSWEIDLRDNSQVWSDGMYAVFGIPNTERPSVELFLSAIHPDDLEFSTGKVETAFKMLVASTFDFRFIKGDGEVRFANTEYHFEFNKKGEPLRLYGVVKDTTEREVARSQIVQLNEELEQKVMKRTEELEFIIKELEGFSYSVSHDLRAPIRAINGYAAIMEEDYSGDLTVDGLKVLHSIKDNSKKMGELIDDLLAFSQLGRQKIVVSEVNMNELVNSITKELLYDMDKSKIEIIIGDLHSVQADQTLLRQVWINLISNAIKYATCRSKAIISIGSSKKENSIVYNIKDNGVGFDMQYYDVMFGVFQRLHSQEEYEGTGIGLAIVQKIVQRHHGTVWATSKPGEGANFFFSLPCTNA